MKEACAILEGLGLTIVQAKTYFILSGSESLNVLEIANLSRIKRPYLYGVLKELEERGLVEREIDYPIRYRGLPFDEALDLLVQKKRESDIKLQRKVTDLRNTIAKLPKQRSERKTLAKFLLVPNSRIISNLSKAIERTQKNAKLILSTSRFSKGLIRFSNEIERSCSRGVKWNFITEKPDGNKILLDQIAFVEKSPSCQVKFLRAIPRTIAAIYDQEEVFIFETPAESINGSPALWSNNDSLISLVNDYFEMLWFTAVEDKYQVV